MKITDKHRVTRMRRKAQMQRYPYESVFICGQKDRCEAQLRDKRRDHHEGVCCIDVFIVVGVDQDVAAA